MISEPRLKRIKHVVSQRQQGLTVILEDISDPHNAAAVLRSCDAFGVQSVSFIFNKQKKFNPRSIGKLSSASANKWLDFQFFSTPQDCVDSLHKKKFQIISTVLEAGAQSLFDTNLDKDGVALVFGNEHAGVSPELVALSDSKLYIPMRGFVQSLNLSVTAGIVLAEATRQRMLSKNLMQLSASSQAILVSDFSKR